MATNKLGLSLLSYAFAVLRRQVLILAYGMNVAREVSLIELARRLWAKRCPNTTFLGLRAFITLTTQVEPLIRVFQERIRI